MRNKPTSINISPEDLAAVDAAASAAGVSRSAWIVSTIRAALAGGLAQTEAAEPASLADRVAALEAWQRGQVQPPPPAAAEPPAAAAEPPAAEPPAAEPPAAEPPAAEPPAPAAKRAGAKHDPEAIAAVFAYLAQGKTPGQIADLLNAAGYKPVKAGLFHTDTIRYIIDAPANKEARRKAGIK